MRWLVEVSSIGKTESQKCCVEAESWQRALQAARAQRGEDGPMSGFSIELLEEGYRAVDPVARVRFVVKRAPDDMPLTPGPGKDASSTQKTSGVPPTPPSADPTDPKMAPPPAPSSASSVDGKRSVPRPNASSPQSGVAKTPSVPPAPLAKPAFGASPASARTLVFGSGGEATINEAPPTERMPPAVGSPVQGLPPVKLLSSREQNPSDGSPLTYREYAFAIPEGTSDEVAAEMLRAQLRIIEAHIVLAKTGKLVNLAVFDVEFAGKPPRAPIATLMWKDWKGDPIVAFPRSNGPASKPPRPPSKAPPSLLAHAPPMDAMPAPPAVPQFPAPPAPHAIPAAPHTMPLIEAAPKTPAPPAITPAAPPVHVQDPNVTVQMQPVTAFLAQAGLSPPPDPPRAQTPGQALAPHAPPTPVMTEAEPRTRPPSNPPAGMVRTPSGRFVRGRVSGDELITALFESMHDLHFLRDALDGGQFCLALATEVLPARAALIHFMDIEKREWVVACTRGKDTHRLLTSRSPEADEMLVTAARKRRAVVFPNASDKATTARYTQVGGGRSVIVAPIMQAGRALGAMEIINPLDGMPFSEDEGNAMTYIAEQYAEYLGSRGIVLDRDRIQSAAAAR